MWAEIQMPLSQELKLSIVAALSFHNIGQGKGWVGGYKLYNTTKQVVS